MEKLMVKKNGEPYNQPGFELPLAFKEGEPDFGASRVRLCGHAVQQLGMSLAGFRDQRFDMLWGEQVFRGCRVVEESANSAVLEFASSEGADDEPEE